MDARLERLAAALRDITRGGLAGALAGVLVVGVGGRLAMTIAARLNPADSGAFTEAGNVVGRFTVDGTLAFLLFNGLGVGMAAGVAWVVISPWLPTRRGRRLALAFGACALIGSGFVIESRNSDFQLLDPKPLLVAMFVGLIGLLGVVTASLDAFFDGRLPRAGSTSLVRRLIPYGGVAVLGIPGFLLTVQAFFSSEFRTAAPPIATGVALVVCGVATVAWWVTRPPRAEGAASGQVAVVGRLGVVAAAALGGVQLWNEVTKILAG